MPTSIHDDSTSLFSPLLSNPLHLLTLGALGLLLSAGFGYLDKWHAFATLLLLPCFTIGLARTYRTLQTPRSITSLFKSPIPSPPTRRARYGRLLLLTTSAIIIAAGLTITTVGMTTVF